jgi:hypothetical protein
MRFDGEKVIDPKDPCQVMVLEPVLDIPDDPSESQSFSIEDGDPLRRRLQPMLIITTTIGGRSGGADFREPRPSQAGVRPAVWSHPSG